MQQNNATTPPQEIRQERFQMLEDIARELAGPICFPCCLDVSLRARSVLKNPEASLDDIVAIVRVDPLLSAQLLGLANSPTHNPGGRPTLNLSASVERLGLPLTRAVTLKLATEQMLGLKELVDFSTLSTLLWEHTISCAAAASVLARHFTRIAPEEAMLTGLLHDIGAFYMLYKANQYPELRNRPDSLQYLIVQWHESIGESLIGALGLPEAIGIAIRDHDRPRSVVHAPNSLTEVLFVANLLAGAIFEWQRNELTDVDNARPELGNPAYLALFDEIAGVRESLLAPFAKPLRRG